MMRVLLAKDLRRACRNPLPWLINVALPLCITALIGLAFGGRSDSGALGRIRFAVVDEDDSMLTQLLRGAANQREGGKYLEPVFLDRENALRQVTDNQLSAVLIIPTNFTRSYLTGRERVNFELIKNPAQSIHPAVLEELLGAVVTALNALARNFRSEFPELQAVIEGRGDYHRVAGLVERAGDRLKTLSQFVNPPLVSYERELKAVPKPGESKKGPSFNLFGYLLVGMAGMFLLFLAGHAMTDLHRELRMRTFERYHTLRQRLLPFLAAKVLFAVVLLLFNAAVMLVGGALVFRIHWSQPAALAALTLGYTGFAACLMALLVAWVADERRANTLHNIAGMALGMAGGCAFPPQQLPGFLREHITPLLPSYWFAETARNLQSGGANVPWGWVTLKLALLSAGLLGLAALLFRRRFKAGLRS
jgi:ABC-type multidrug transport system permease subunit